MKDDIEISKPDISKPILDEPPPALGTWPRVYVSVLVYLAVVIATFYLVTRRLAP